MSLYWTLGFSSCSRALVTVDGATTNIACDPGPVQSVSYNVLAYTSPALDPAIAHTIVVQLDPGSLAANKYACLDLDRFEIVRLTRSSALTLQVPPPVAIAQLSTPSSTSIESRTASTPTSASSTVSLVSMSTPPVAQRSSQVRSTCSPPH